MYKSKITHNPFADKIYNINMTLAFPSSMSIVEKVPELKAMKKAADEAKVGESVAFHVLYKNAEDTIVFEKVSVRMWKRTRLKMTDDVVKIYGHPDKLQGLNFIRALVNEHYRSYSRDNRKPFTEAYEKAYLEQ